MPSLTCPYPFLYTAFALVVDCWAILYMLLTVEPYSTCYSLSVRPVGGHCERSVRAPFVWLREEWPHPQTPSQHTTHPLHGPIRCIHRERALLSLSQCLSKYMHNYIDLLLLYIEPIVKQIQLGDFKRNFYHYRDGNEIWVRVIIKSTVSAAKYV